MRHWQIEARQDRRRRAFEAGALGLVVLMMTAFYVLAWYAQAAR